MIPTNIDVSLSQSGAARELARFFQVAGARGDAPTVMPACPVDTFWHEFQMQGAEFSDFCLEYAGGEVAHREIKGHGPIEWVGLYHSMFGETLPPIWFYSPDGQRFNHDAWDEFQSGEVRLSWDCTPEIIQEPVPGPSQDGVSPQQCLPELDVKRLTV